MQEYGLTYAHALYLSLQQATDNKHVVNSEANLEQNKYVVSSEENLERQWTTYSST